MVLVELASVLNAYIEGELTEMDVRLDLFLLPDSDEIFYTYSILHDLRRVAAYLDYINCLIYYDRHQSDDSDDT